MKTWRTHFIQHDAIKFNYRPNAFYRRVHILSLITFVCTCFYIRLKSNTPAKKGTWNFIPALLSTIKAYIPETSVKYQLIKVSYVMLCRSQRPLSLILLNFSDTVDPYKVWLIMHTSSSKLIQLADPLRSPYSLQALSK